MPPNALGSAWSSSTAMALPASMRVMADVGVVFGADVHGLDHLAVRQQAVAPGFAAGELDQVDAALIDDLVDLLGVVAGEDADRQRAFALQQAVERRRAVLEPGRQVLLVGAERRRAACCISIAASGVPSARTISDASSSSMRRRLLGANIRPTKSAPASAAASATSTLRQPQILTRVIRRRGTPGICIEAGFERPVVVSIGSR